ncbi:MAG: 2-dehydropantoate 2-reductase [Pseudomonadota bacterium]
MPSITLIGPGAIGATLAAWLSQNPRNEVSVAARTRFETLEVTTPDRVVVASPRVLTDKSHAQPADWVLVATKAYDSAAAATWFETACGPQTRVAVIQNGVEHVERFLAWLPRERILPVMIDVPADRTAPGKVTQRGPIHIVVPAGENGAAFVGLFGGLNLDVVESPDFTTAAWKKLCLNSAGAVCAALLKPAGIVHHEAVADVMRAIVRECIAVGRAQGATLDDAIAEEIIERMRRGPRDAANSMLADRRAGRPMEIDARNDVIVRLGRRHGIEAPMNALMVALLQAAQDF